MVKNATCDAVIYHGPGHQSVGHCQRPLPHDVHEYWIPGDRVLLWRGDRGMTGFFDESPLEEDDDDGQ